MKTAWLSSLLALGIAGSIATACTISTSDGDGLGGSSGDSGGSTAAGGASSGGATAKGGTTAAGGTAAGGTAAGGAATGGSATGGAAPEPVVKCDGVMSSGTPAMTCEFTGEDKTFCHECLTKSCCDAVQQCYGFGPGTIANQCAYGGPDGGSEFTCFEACLIKKTKAGGGEYQDADVDACADMCATPACGGIVGNATNDLIECMTNPSKCEKDCILDPAKL